MSFPFHYFFENIDLRWRLSTQLITLWTCVKKDNIGLAQIFENSIIENKNPNHRLLYSIYYNKTHYTMYFVLIPLNLCKCFKIHNVHMRYRKHKNFLNILAAWERDRRCQIRCAGELIWVMAAARSSNRRHISSLRTGVSDVTTLLARLSTGRWLPTLLFYYMFIVFIMHVT